MYEGANPPQIKVSPLLQLLVHSTIERLKDLFSGYFPHTCQVTVLIEKLLAEAINF